MPAGLPQCLVWRVLRAQRELTSPADQLSTLCPGRGLTDPPLPLLPVQVDQRVFRDLMSEKLPRLHAHFEQYKVDYTLITFNWFLVVFVDSVVSDILFKIWDSFLYEGPKVGLLAGDCVGSLSGGRVACSPGTRGGPGPEPSRHSLPLEGHWGPRKWQAFARLSETSGTLVLSLGLGWFPG